MFKQHHAERYLMDNRHMFPRPALVLKALDKGATRGLIATGNLIETLGEEHTDALNNLAQTSYQRLRAPTGHIENVRPWFAADDLRLFLDRYPETVADRTAAEEQIEGVADGKGYVYYPYAALIFGEGGVKSFEAFLDEERARRYPPKDTRSYMLPD